MRTGVSFTVGSEDSRRLEAIVRDRNAKQKLFGAPSSRAGMVAAPWRSCAGPASRRPVSGVGSSVSRGNRYMRLLKV